jgi:hypothetical protein
VPARAGPDEHALAPTPRAREGHMQTPRWLRVAAAILAALAAAVLAYTQAIDTGPDEAQRAAPRAVATATPTPPPRAVRDEPRRTRRRRARPAPARRRRPDQRLRDRLHDAQLLDARRPGGPRDRRALHRLAARQRARDRAACGRPTAPGPARTSSSTPTAAAGTPCPSASRAWTEIGWEPLHGLDRVRRDGHRGQAHGRRGREGRPGRRPDRRAMASRSRSAT